MNKIQSTEKLQLIYTIGINKAQTLRLAAYGTLLIFLATSLFNYLLGHDAQNVQVNPLIAVIVYFVTLIIHEAVHGFFFTIFGGKPKYGVGMMYYVFPYAYATAHGQPYTLRQMCTIALAPLILVCGSSAGIALLIPGITQYALIAFVGNFAGAIGDIWLSSRMLRFMRVKNLQVVDLKNGLAIYGIKAGAEKLVAKAKNLDNPKSRLARFSSATFSAFIALLLLSVAAPIALDALNYHGHIVIGPEKLALFDVNTLPGNISAAVNFVPLLIASLLFATLYSSALHTRK